MTDWHEMRPVDLDFLDRAPLCVEVVVATQLPRQRVWATFVDPRAWSRWFPGVR